MMNSSIASSFAGCLEEYEHLIFTLTQANSPLRDQLSLNTVQDELGRFKVWAGNLAAHKTGRSSLDFRLRDATPLRERVIALLDDMSELLREAICMASGARIPRDNLNFESDSDSDTDSSDGGSTRGPDTLTAIKSVEVTTELQEIFRDIVVVIDCLYRLSMSIRNGVSAHDRLVKAATINTSFFESWDIEHVKTKFPATKEALASRLGKAISRRRQYFKYCERHHKKLAQDLVVRQNPAPIVSSPQIAVEEAPELFNDDNEAVAESIEPTVDNSKLEIERSIAATTVLTQTTASEFIGGDNDFEVESDSGQTSTSYATTASLGGRLVIPPLPRESIDGRPFECPYCYTIVSIRNSQAWKKHIFRDLQPYVCTADACGKAGKLFDTRRDWWDHELLHHRKEWFCTADCQQIFKVQSEFEEHMRATHAITSDHQLDALVDMCHRPVDENAEEQCPLCSERFGSMKQFCRHLAHHLEELALFALPRHKDEDHIDDFDSDKPQPSNFSRELSVGSLSFASNSLHNDSTSEAGDDVETDYKDFDTRDSQLDSKSPETIGSIQEGAAGVLPDDEDSAAAIYLLEDFKGSTTPKLPSAFLPRFNQHIKEMLNGTDNTLVSRDDDFVRLFNEVAQMLPGQNFQHLLKSKGQIGDMLLVIYLHARKCYKKMLGPSEEVISGGILDHVRALFVRAIRDSIEGCNVQELDYQGLIRGLERLEAKLTARAESLPVDDKEEQPSHEFDESWAKYWNITEDQLVEYTTKEFLRQDAIYQFWRQETLYVKNLTFCVENYKEELTREWLQVPVFNWIQEALQIIRDLKELQEIFLHSLENRIKTQGPRVRELSDFIEQWLPKANVLYGHYAQRLPIIEWKIKSYAAANPTFQGLFYTEANESKWAKYVQCPSAMISSYTELCNRILANTEAASVDHAKFLKVSQGVRALVRSVRNLQARGRSAVRILQLDEAFVFRTKLPEVNKDDLMLKQPSRQLFHEGEVERVSTERNEVSFTGSIHAEKYEVFKQPIPIYLLILENSNNDVSWKASAITKVNEVNNDGGISQQRALNKSDASPALYPFKIKDLGSGEVSTLLVKTSEQRKEWWDKIKLAQISYYAALQESKEEPYSLNILSNGDFRNDSSKPFNRDFNIGGSPLSKAIHNAGPVVQKVEQVSRGVECATVSFRDQARKMIAIGAKTGFFVFQLGTIKVGPTPTLPVLTEDIGIVTQIVEVIEFNVTLVLGSTALYAYDTVTITGTRVESEHEPVKKLLDNVEFFRIVTMGASKLLYCVLRPDRFSKPVIVNRGASVIVLELYKGEAPTTRKKTSPFSKKQRNSINFDSSTEATPLTFVPRGYYYRKHDAFQLMKAFSDLVIFPETIVVLTDRAFEMMDLRKKLPKVIPDSRGLKKALELPRTIGNRQPLGMFRLPDGITYEGVSEYFICVYEDCAIHTDQNADITRNNCITFTGPATSATLDSHYLFLFHAEYLEIRNVITGDLCQIIVGQDIRPMEGVKSGNVLMAMQHPDSAGREVILECVLNDEKKRMIEGKGELRVRDGGLTAREESSSRWENVSAQGEASTRTAAGPSRGDLKGDDGGKEGKGSKGGLFGWFWR